MSASPPAVLVVSSHVVRGSVGARAAFALERLGHRVWTLPTVILPWHPGHGRAHRLVPPAADFAALCADLCKAPWLEEIGAVLTGYLGDAAQAGPIAELVAAVRAANPEALVVVDPIAGDANGLYVPAEVAEAQRDVLLPLADIALPNRYELAHYAGRPTETMAELVEAARSLGPERVVVTSAPALMRGKIAAALVSPTGALVAENAFVADAPSGTGDLFAALLTSRLLQGASDEAALAGATAGTFELIARSVRMGSDELELTVEQGSIIRPTALVDVRRWSEPRRPAARVPVRTATRIAGVDGCPGGWIAVVRDLATGEAKVEVIRHFADLLDRPDAPMIVAVDMPIGLPDRVGHGGRGAERAVRGLLGMRQSSVFSVPARAAVYAPDYSSACAAALAASDPPRKVSKQCFHLFPKIREIDELLVARPELRSRVFESHPEVAFAVLAGGPMSLPKKVKGAGNPSGLDERRTFLAGRGFDAALLAARPPRGAAADDLLDAAVCSLVAERILKGEALPHPPEEIRDALGLRIAIWA